ncbi:PRC-barrel domain-containing protein [Jannaschia sp. KMU-145]|uniref:PRC-barrel domain-containing protein n=1 Tax=Jannaschia halovivens TaxID=3388667 RepID=UPI00396AF569
MKLLRTSLATLALTGTAALADGHAAAPFSVTTLEYGQSYLATTLIGTRVHATDGEIDPTAALPAGTVADWDDIGEIGDLIIGVDGSLQAVVIDVGGFLGLGEREVALDWSALRGVREDDDPGEYFLGVTMSEGMLEDAPELVRTPAE